MNLFDIEAAIKLNARGVKGQLTTLIGRSEEAAAAMGELAHKTNLEKGALDRIAKVLPKATPTKRQITQTRNLTKAVGTLAAAYQALAKAQAGLTGPKLGSVSRKAPARALAEKAPVFPGTSLSPVKRFNKKKPQHSGAQSLLNSIGRVNAEKAMVSNLFPGVPSPKLDAELQKRTEAAADKFRKEQEANFKKVAAGIQAEKDFAQRLAAPGVVSKSQHEDLQRRSEAAADKFRKEQEALAAKFRKDNLKPGTQLAPVARVNQKKSQHSDTQSLLGSINRKVQEKAMAENLFGKPEKPSVSEQKINAAQKAFRSNQADIIKSLPTDPTSGPYGKASPSYKKSPASMDLSKSMQDVSNQMNKQVKEMNRLDKIFGKTTASAAKFKNQQAQLDAGSDKLSKGIARNTGLLGKFGGAMRTVRHFATGMAVYSVFMGIGSAIRSAISTTSEFQVALRELNALARVPDEKLFDISQYFRGTTQKFGLAIDPTDLVKGQRSLYAAGYDDIDTATKLAEQGALMARVTQMEDTQKGIELLGSSMKAYGADASQAEHYTNVLINSTDQGTVTMEQMAQSLGRAAPIAADAGISFDELASLIGTVTSKGVRTETAVTGIAAAIKNLTNQSGPAKETLKKYGLEINETTIRAKGLLGTLKEIYAATGGSQEAIGNIFGAQRAKVAVSAVAGDFALAEKNVANVGKEGTAKKRAEQISQTAAEQWKIVVQNIKNALTWLGDELDAIFASIFKSFNEAKPELNTLLSTLKTIFLDIFNSLNGSSGAGMATAIQFVADTMWDFYKTVRIIITSLQHFMDRAASIGMLGEIKESKERKEKIEKLNQEISAREQVLVNLAGPDPLTTFKGNYNSLEFFTANSYFQGRTKGEDYQQQVKLIEKDKAAREELLKAEKAFAEQQKNASIPLIDKLVRLDAELESARIKQQAKPQAFLSDKEIAAKNIKTGAAAAQTIADEDFVDVPTPDLMPEDLKKSVASRLKVAKHEGSIGRTGLGETKTTMLELLEIAKKYTDEKDLQMKIEKEIFRVSEAQEAVVRKKLVEAKKARQAEIKKAKENVGLKEAEFGEGSLEAQIAALDYEFIRYERNEKNKFEVYELYMKKRAKLEDEFNKRKEAATVSLRSVTISNEADVLEAKGETEKADKLRRQQALDEEVQAIRERIDAMREAQVDEVEIARYIESEKQRLRMEGKQQGNPKEPNKVMDPSEYVTDPRGQSMVQGSKATTFSGIGGDFSKVGATQWASKKKKKAYDPATATAIMKIDGIDRKVKAKDLPKDHPMHPDRVKEAEEKKNEMTVNVIIREEDANGNVILRTNNKAQGERTEGTYERGRT